MTVHTFTQQHFSGVKPLLIQGAVERTGDDHIPGRYCPDHHVWMVDGTPIVDLRASLSELTTKTRAQIERDDSSNISLLEMQTKTNAQIERDDQDYEINLNKLMTKTAADTKRDD
jgi:hypothetical protein